MKSAGIALLTVIAAVLLARPAAAAGSGDIAPAPYLQSLIERARTERLSEDRVWQVLLHYRAHGSGFVSEADGPDFFVDPNGKKNPEAELEATIAAFARAPDPPPDDNHPQCRFPARYKWLKARLGFDAAQLPEQPCPGFSKWTEDVAPASATLVFASSQIDAPASMYGHTFLRLERAGPVSRNALLSTAVTYSAYPWTRNPVLYVVLGLAGGFQGKFQVLPYFVKVQEYTNLDSRDLWEYPLTLDADQIDWLMRHLWELDHTWFDYFFFKENCSYHLMGLLDVAAPAAHLTDNFHAWALPVDTVRVAQEAGLAATPVCRPSHIATMRARRDTIARGDRPLVARLSDAKAPMDYAAINALPPERQAAVLDASFDLLKFRYGFRPGVREAEYSDEVRLREKVLLHRRSEIPILTAAPVVKPGLEPLAGHLSARGAVGIRSTGSLPPALEIAWRPAEHDLLDPPAGYPPDAAVEMFSFALRVDPSHPSQANMVLLERADFVKISSFVPFEEWIHKSSWRVGFGAGRVREKGCVTWKCEAADFEFAYGASFRADPGFKQIVYVMGETKIGAGPAFQPGFRAGAGPVAGLLAEPAPWWRIRAEGALRYDAIGDRGDHVWNVRDALAAPAGNATLRALDPVWSVDVSSSVSIAPNTTLRVEGARYRTRNELFVGLLRYF